MSDINTYADEAAITALTPINGDLVLNRDNNSLYLCTDSSESGIARWKKFTNDGASVPPVFSNNRLALDLDGDNDYLDCGGNTDFSFTDGAGNDSAFSISAWVKLDSNNRSRVAAKGNMEWLFGTSYNNRLALYLWGNSSTSDYLARSDTSDLATGTWQHIVATYDGSKTAGGINLYRAGSLVTMTDISVGNYLGMDSNQGALRIGQWEFNSSVMDGLIDEVSVFDYELTSSQVSDIYNETNGNGSPADISSLNPSGWWRMGDNDSGIAGQSAAAVSDVSGNELHATQGTAASQPTFADLTGETIYV